MTLSLYLDTSALAKWFFVELRSEDFVRFITEAGRAIVTPLTRLELHCLAFRRLRSGEIDEAYAADISSTFEGLCARRTLVVHPIEGGDFVAAEELLLRFGGQVSLRTLDALHLAAARRAGARTFATADKALASAAEAVGFDVARFD